MVALVLCAMSYRAQRTSYASISHKMSSRLVPPLPWTCVKKLVPGVTTLLVVDTGTLRHAWWDMVSHLHLINRYRLVIFPTLPCAKYQCRPPARWYQFACVYCLILVWGELLTHCYHSSDWQPVPAGSVYILCFSIGGAALVASSGCIEYIVRV